MTPSRARLQELLAIGATQRLSAAEEAELDTLLEAFPDQEPDEFELAAAALHLALADTSEELPPALAEQLHLAAVAVMPSPPQPKRLQRPAWMAWSGWAIAAGLAGLLIYSQLNPKVVKEYVEVLRDVPRDVIKPEPTLDQRREEIRKDGKVFAGAKNGLSASVVWSGSKQDGVLEVSGLAPNEPTKQYQLWVFDSTRGKEPISVGVFDAVEGKTFVRVRASLTVRDATTFAISKEPRGGLPQPTQVVMVIPAAKPS